jgi:phytoene dehydrogenase-like protein
VPKYDVAVSGAGLGGLAAAALLSSRKKKMIVLDQSGSLNHALGVFEKDGFFFFSTPRLSYGFQRGEAIHEFSVSLGITHDISVHSPCYQVALPDRRITVFSEQGETLEELKREFPGEINRVVRFYRDLHTIALRDARNRLSAYISKHRGAAGFIGKYDFSREFIAFLDVQSLWFFQKPAADLSLSSLILLCDTPPTYLHGGFKKFADQLYEIILQQGGEVRYHEKTHELVLKDGHVIGIRTGQSGLVEADTILLNTVPPQHMLRLFIGLRDEVIPVGMCQEVLFLPEYAKPRDFIALSVSAKDDVGSAPRGMRALTASFRSEQPPQFDRDAFLMSISRLIPFLQDYMIFTEKGGGTDSEIVVPADVTFKRLGSDDEFSVIYRGSKKNVFRLNDSPSAPLQVISAVQRFVKKLM